MTHTQTVVLFERIDDRGNISRLRFVRDDGKPMANFTAGAHIDIYLPEVDMWRQYSLCSDPAETRFYEIGVLKDPNSRGGSTAVHKSAIVGQKFEITGPRNHFTLDETAEKTILLGGGIGVTPMIAMATRLHQLGKDFELHYCTRSQDVTAFHDVLRDAPFAANVVFHHDDKEAAQKLDLTRDVPAPAPGVHLYVCGPQGFMDWVIETTKSAGHASANVHFEYFSADVDLTGNSFEVEARASGITVTVGEGDTIAKALAAVGIDVDVKCEEGVCGTCITDVIEVVDGALDHRDEFLTDDEKEDADQICVCCSRASGKLILDI